VSDFDDYRRAKKRPAPKHGVKVKKPGTTWWGARWIDALAAGSPGLRNRLARGRTYARAGRAHDLVIAPGRVTAKVTGTRCEPYEIEIAIPPFGDEIWEEAVRAMASEAAFSAELLAARMPARIDEAFAKAGAALFPASEDLETSCSCPDWANPCKHVAATHYVLGQAFDRDPFLLFELRGRTRDEALAAIRAARGASERRAAIAGVKIGRTSAGAYRALRRELPALQFSFEPSAEPAVVLGQLGNPPGWSDPASIADLLSPIICAAAEQAAAIALAEPDDRE
jgi:uncharacterized Zn finger protein